MKTKARTFIGRLALVASVLGISTLGELRVQASERSMVSGVAHGAMSDSSPGTVRQIARHLPASALGSDEDGAASNAGPDHGSAADEAGQVVPAIYAWDPDVRFVYFRHVSKWM